MKKIVLIGDSTRLGYDVLIREAYQETAQVYFPKDNSCFAAHTLRWLHEWKNEMQCGDNVDCVHWNVGHWDNLILFEDGPMTPIHVYKEYLERICRRIQLLFPKAKVIFATSTPMYEALFPTPEIAVRYNKDIEAYNEAAVAAVSQYGNAIDDLYELLKDVPTDYFSDSSHFFTRTATKLIVNDICSVIDRCLDIKAAEPNYDFWFDETDCYEGTAWLQKRGANISKNAPLGI